jgi:cycloartenol synthase
MFVGAAAFQVYLPMSYIYGIRGTCKETPLTAAIR